MSDNEKPDFNAIERNRWGGPSPWTGKDSRTDAQKLDDDTDARTCPTCGTRLPSVARARTATRSDEDSLTEALAGAVAALNRNGFVTRSAALYDLAEAVTRHLGLEWNPYGQTVHPDGTITSRDEDIRP